jgi:hypothetical protein
MWNMVGMAKCRQAADLIYKWICSADNAKCEHNAQYDIRPSSVTEPTRESLVAYIHTTIDQYCQCQVRSYPNRYALCSNVAPMLFYTSMALLDRWWRTAGIEVTQDNAFVLWFLAFMHAAKLTDDFAFDTAKFAKLGGLFVLCPKTTDGLKACKEELADLQKHTDGLVQEKLPPELRMTYNTGFRQSLKPLIEVVKEAIGILDILQKSPSSTKEEFAALPKFVKNNADFTGDDLDADREEEADTVTALLEFLSNFLEEGEETRKRQKRILQEMDALCAKARMRGVVGFPVIDLERKFLTTLTESTVLEADGTVTGGARVREEDVKKIKKTMEGAAVKHNTPPQSPLVHNPNPFDGVEPAPGFGVLANAPLN